MQEAKSAAWRPSLASMLPSVPDVGGGTCICRSARPQRALHGLASLHKECLEAVVILDKTLRSRAVSSLGGEGREFAAW